MCLHESVQPDKSHCVRKVTRGALEATIHEQVHLPAHANANSLADFPPIDVILLCQVDHVWLRPCSLGLLDGKTHLSPQSIILGPTSLGRDLHTWRARHRTGACVHNSGLNAEKNISTESPKNLHYYAHQLYTMYCTHSHAKTT